VRLFAQSLLDELAAKASASPRARAHFNIHASPEERVQRFFVAVNRNSYIRPHRHNTRAELAMVVRGSFDVLTFDEHGTVTARYTVGEANATMGFEMAPATWHTLIAHSDGCAFLEIKEGPYDPAVAAEFAPWAPAEGDPAVPAFLERIRTAQPGASLR
jgi:cupin fold WbuC family metalloprotein